MKEVNVGGFVFVIFAEKAEVLISRRVGALGRSAAIMCNGN